MRNLKKFLALALAMVMAFSLMVTANAAHAGTQYNDEDTVTPAFSEAVEVLTGMGVFQGDSGSFRPASNITRAEVAAIIYRLATGDTGTDKMDLYTTRHPFTDVRSDAWYAGYVGYLYNAKIIKGTTATTFNPAGNVTGYEVLAMILRAVGYDKNDEFTGATWTVEVASTATNLGILRDIDSTHYGDTLHLASRRDVVASMLFRTAAYVPMVQYTLAFGYQNTGMSGSVVGSKLNPTLGYKNFGLTEDTGIVVGNQATGEARTKIGYTVQEHTDGFYFTDVAYAYGQNSHDSATEYKGKTTIEYNFNTGLELFGHKVTAWYNGKSAAGSVNYYDEPAQTNKIASFGSRFATYAIVDKASMDKTVFANNDTLNAAGTGGAISLMDAANANGFSANTQSSAYMSDRYSQFSGKLGDGSAESKVGMYRLISNSGKGVDVVIALNQEVAMINQVNTTIKNGEYIYLGAGASNFGNRLTGGAKKGLILFDQMTGASVKTLGTVVTAHQIVGTTNIFSADTNDHTYANANGMQPEYAMYQTDKLEPTLTGTIATYILPGNAGNSNVSNVTLTDGTVINLSGITGSNDPYAFDSYEHLVNGVTKLTGSNTAAGVTYSFYMDEVGRFIGVGIPNDYSFLYTTFADYQIGNLGTGTIGYYAYGVDWDGNIVKDKQISSITLPTTTDGTLNNLDKFDEASGAKTTYPSAGKTLSMGYNALPITMKNQGTVATVGNEIRQGANTRFVMNPAGNMSWYNEGGKYGTRFIGFDNTQGIVQPGTTITANDFSWEITSNDVVNGFKRVYGSVGNGQNAYLLTNATKFIVVSGSGTADLAVKTYNGIGELVGNGSSAAISVNWDATNSKLTGDNVYFLTSADRYGNVNTSDNATIDTVILSDSNLNNYAANSLFFAAPGAQATGVKLAGTNDANINQYKLYSNGQVGYYWVDDSISGGATGDVNTGDFYQMTPVKTINGQTIYRAVKVTDVQNNNVGAIYNYIVVNDMSTAEITFSNGQKQVFKVTAANVTEAFGTNTPVITTNTIDSVLKLNHAVSMGQGNGNSGDLYKVSVAIVYSGINVVDIYVTNIA